MAYAAKIQVWYNSRVMRRVLLIFLCMASAIPTAECKAPPSNPVTVEGVVRSVVQDDLDRDWLWMELTTPSNTLPAAVPTTLSSYGELRRAIDAEVRITGNIFETSRIPLLKSARIIVKKPIETLSPAPKDPFSAPLFKFHDISPHRRRVVGTVLAARKDCLFMRESPPRHYPIKAMLSEDSAIPPVGAKVTAAGFMRVSSFSRYLTETLVRVDGAEGRQTGEEGPMDTDAEALFTTSNGCGKVNARFFGRLVRIRGTAMNDYADGDADFIMKNGRKTFRVDMGLPVGGVAGFRAGTEIEVTGICDLEFEDTFGATLFPRFRNFAILPRTAADVKTLATPPWWTPLRLVCVIAMLALALAATLVWNRSLTALSKRRGRALYREQIDHAAAELKVEERSRLATEIHDSLSQTLTGVSLQIDAAVRSGSKDFKTARGFLETARLMLASCRHELRCCIWDLRSRTFDEKDMTEAVKRAIAPHTGQATVAVRFNVPREMLSDGTTHTILRIVRELVVNAIRHGMARHVAIAGEFHNGIVRFSVKDDGTGFDTSATPGPELGHFGLQGIRERIANLHGKMEIESSPGKGTKVSVSILKPDAVGQKEADIPEQ